jgi:hypothetical protein
MKKVEDVSPDAAEIISDAITSIERVLGSDGMASRTLLLLILDNLKIARDYLASHTSRGYLRRVK